MLLIYECDPGYKLNGSSKLKCVRGAYDLPAPSCIGMLKLFTSSSISIFILMRMWNMFFSGV